MIILIKTINNFTNFSRYHMNYDIESDFDDDFMKTLKKLIKENERSPSFY